MNPLLSRGFVVLGWCGSGYVRVRERFTVVASPRSNFQAVWGLGVGPRDGGGRIWECGVVSSAGRGRREKRAQKKLRRGRRARRPAPRFGGLDQHLDPDVMDGDGAGG